MEHGDAKPRIFISYSHDTNAHRERVVRLSERLRADGIETCLDQYVTGTPTEGWPRWMLNKIDWAEFILLVCTETYYRRFRGHAEPGKGKGVDWEGAVITQELYDARSATIRFVPVLFDATDERFIPEPVCGHTFYVLNSEQAYQDLYDFLLGQAGVEPGPVGEPKRKSRGRADPLAFGEEGNSRAGEGAGRNDGQGPIVSPSSPSASTPTTGANVPPPPPLTELQKLLQSYLEENWATLRTQEAFTGADLFRDPEKAVPLSPERVFAIACDRPPLKVLLGARKFFEARAERGFSPAAAVSEADGIVCSAIVRCALVAAERYVRDKVDAEADAHHDHDPVRSSEHLVACIEAAVRLGFGLCFSAGSSQPENVFRLVHPVPEPGVPGEEGAALSAVELLATLDRGEPQTGKRFDLELLKAIIEIRTEKLKTGLVVSTDAAGRFESVEKREDLLKYLKDKFGLRTFFQQRGDDAMLSWAKEMEDTLLYALGPIFAISRETAKTKEEKMPERESERAATPAVTHLTT